MDREYSSAKSMHQVTRSERPAAFAGVNYYTGGKRRTQGDVFGGVARTNLHDVFLA